MKREEFKENIIDFKKKVVAYKKFLFASLDYGEIVTNHEKIGEKRSELVKEYAKLELYIKTVGQNPRMHDGVWATLYSVYDNGLSSDIVSRVCPSIEAMITDLDYIEGKLESISEKEFSDIFNKKTSLLSEKKSISNHWNFINPFWIIYQLIIIAWRHKIISGIITTLVGAYLVWKFGWTK